MVFSDLHTTGEQLLQITGIAAILHFPMVFFNLFKEELEDEVENNGLIELVVVEKEVNI
jgi:hypothetical protein